MLKVVQQTVERPAPPSRLYAMYLEATAHAAFTDGGPVVTWRSFEWQEVELSAVLLLVFTPTAQGALVDLVQAGVPERLYDALMDGWPVRYWQPRPAYLEGRR
jgi:hypothetical protein